MTADSQDTPGWTATDVHIGSPDQWEPFVTRNALFVQRMPNLVAAFDVILNRRWSSDEPIDRVVFIAGHLTVDDYMEIFTLAGNGEGYGAEKLLRSMFERVVTLKYLHANPEEFDRYMNYYWIHQHKLMNAVETTFKKGLVQPERAKEIEANYAKYKDDYKITLCKECGTTRPGISWTPVDIVTMAKKVGLQDLIVPCYYMPMLQAHPTPKGMLDRIKDEEGRMAPDERHNLELADRVLSAAHVLVLYALDVQVEHFKLDEAPYKRAEQDYLEIWKSRTDLRPPAAPDAAESK